MCNILESIDLKEIDNFKSFTDRYFTKRFIVNANGVKNNDIMLMFHSNRITLLSLAPSHFFFKNPQTYSLNFFVGNVDRLCNTVKGKSKKGGQYLTPKSVICKVEYEDGTNFEIPCGMKSTLIEINEELVKNPHLLKEKPDSGGFIAIMLSSIAISDATKKELLTFEDYSKLVSDKVNL
ncbi:protein Abitram [Leptidea sinapis]|uniref:protein Abitram n=1 Tax=Leptidea sinapis TaxID=189913 RepID=UPI0021323ABF|nr:protein Abitram [Leptidea sinapis]